MGKRGIILANTGTPSQLTEAAVCSYLGEFLVDPRIRPMRSALWDVIVKTCILPKRSKASAEKYRRIWTEEGSPLEVHMRSLAGKVQGSLRDNGDADAEVRCAMSYGEPSLERAMAELQQARCDELIVIPLYPQSAFSTTKAVEDKVQPILDALRWAPAVKLVPDYSANSSYQQAIAQAVLAAGFDPAADDLLMAFHSIPMKDIRAGDTYADQVFASARAIAERIGAPDGTWQVGFQCRFDKSRSWLGPFVGEVLPGFDPARRLFVVAPNFSVDCLETLYDIDIVMRQRYFEQHPDARADAFRYVPCLNDAPAHAKVISALI